MAKLRNMGLRVATVVTTGGQHHSTIVNCCSLLGHLFTTQWARDSNVWKRAIWRGTVCVNYRDETIWNAPRSFCNVQSSRKQIQTIETFGNETKIIKPWKISCQLFLNKVFFQLVSVAVDILQHRHHKNSSHSNHWSAPHQDKCVFAEHPLVPTRPRL